MSVLAQLHNTLHDQLFLCVFLDNILKIKNTCLSIKDYCKQFMNFDLTVYLSDYNSKKNILWNKQYNINLLFLLLIL